MEVVLEKECSALGGLFQTLIGDMKSSYPIWEDFITKAGKLQSQLRATAGAVSAFLDAFQKVADLATSSRGGTRDIGSALTRICMRHRNMEAKLKQFSLCFLEGLISPLQEQMEEWKRGVNTLDKDHAKEFKRARQEIKKKSSDTLKLQKKAKKGKKMHKSIPQKPQNGWWQTEKYYNSSAHHRQHFCPQMDVHARMNYIIPVVMFGTGRGDFQPQLDSAMQDVSDKFILLEETEKQALRKALIEERQRFCCFVAMLQPVVDEEISMLAEVSHLQTISEDLKALTSDPHKLPPASEQVILDLKGSDYYWSYQTPPSSPSTTMSRKSSMCSSLNSVNSSDSRGSSGSHSHSPSSSSSSSSSHHVFHHCHPRHRHRSSTAPQQAPARLSSISSHDSGFISSSQDQNALFISSSPLAAETKPCPTSSSPENAETGQLHVECNSPSSLAAAALQSTPEELSNGFDHYSPASPPYLQSNGGSAFPFFPPSSPSSSTYGPSRSWSRPASALLPDFPSYCMLGSPMVPSSRVPSWKDWAKPGPYDQPMVNTLRRKKNKETPAVVDINGSVTSEITPPSGHASVSAPSAGLQTPSLLEDRDRTMAAPQKVDPMEAPDELTLVLSGSLELDTQRSSRDSIQCSSGYSTQTNTPCCSEDTIPSQVSDYDYFSMAGDQDPEQQQQQQSDFDKSSTIPRNSDISQSYRRMFQTKRPASTAGLPSSQPPASGPGGPYPATPNHTAAYPYTAAGLYHPPPSGHGPVIVTPGVATIRRTPSKPSARRSGSLGAGPIPIRTPVVPVKPPTVPGAVNGVRSAEEVEGGESSSDSPTLSGHKEVGLLPVASWSSQASSNLPTAPPPHQLTQQHQEGAGEEANMLVAIRKGVKLKRTLTNDRSAPLIV